MTVRGERVFDRAHLTFLLLVSPGPALAQAPAVPAFALAREVVIDATEQDLSPILWMAVGNDGTIAIAQHQDLQVRFFSARGVPLRTFGRKGHGPGEFAYLNMHGWVGDTLWVADLETRRFTFIGPSGTLVRTQPWPQDVNFSADTPQPRPSFLGVPPWAFYRDGKILTVAYPAREMIPAWMKRPAGTLMPFLKIGSDGAFDRVVAWTPDWGPDCRVGTSSKPLCFRPFWAVSQRGGLVVTVSVVRSDAQNDHVRTIAVNSNADTLLDNVMAVARLRIPRGVADSVRAGFEKTLSKSSPGQTVSFDLPETFPPYERAIVSADEKTVWLESGITTGDRVWRILDLTGRSVGSVRVPRSVQLRVVSLERVWATERDADGLESIVIYRLRR